ncbi:MerR family transcriptional regulator [Solicola gregarius]|uniref:MerR family transcriptional regulator n=1 Tax=Solicola gregarius TaxID=2908642 RepID=A0AA46YJP9_9ACTN|nr:MerR family transcriptional regulator [Solicola gregarius]UYM03824.1 MerR family transcriptional regulator [Solicola gregarius]
MRIGQLAERTGASRRSLRYYEQCGLISTVRSPAGWREYDESAVQRVGNITALLGRGLTIEGIKRLEPCLRLRDLNDCDEPGDAVETYAERLAVVEGRLADLQNQRDRLADSLHTLRGE